jgi:Domain of unknown function (DUF6457)
MADLSPTPDKGQDNDAILTAWCAELVSRLGLDGVEVDVNAVLALAGQVAHAVVRPAAPLTAFVVGYAAGRAVGGAAPEDSVTPATAFESAAATARDAARDFRVAS